MIAVKTLFSGSKFVVFYNSRAVTICLECSHKLPTWYRKMVSTITYNDNKQHFRDKTPNELIKEYEAAFESFSNFKRRTPP